MRYTALGRHTGLRVSEYALGTANFGHAWGGGASREQAKQVFDRFAEAGGTLIDTADCYNFGEAEEYLGEFLAADRDHFVLASKYTCWRRSTTWYVRARCCTWGCPTSRPGGCHVA
jgi:aryl-alcohol dehydrogenase-like predicted oxidoreductase